MFSLIDLKHRVAAFQDHLPRNDALEQRIKIGVGFHDKWYRSQREHWLGWIAVHEYKAQDRGDDPASVLAASLWKLHCIPMMFWLAEAAGLDKDLLDKAELAAVAATEPDGKKKDCPENGGAMRAVLRWVDVETALLTAPFASAKEADLAADGAFDHLASRLKKYRQLRERVGPLTRHTRD